MHADPASTEALVRFLTWALDRHGGQQARFLDAVHFLPLPGAIAAQSRSQVASIR